jgi:hypothetical protein
VNANGFRSLEENEPFFVKIHEFRVEKGRYIMKINVIKTVALGFVFGLVALVGATQVTNAQIRIYAQTDRYDRDDRDDRREILRQAVNQGYQQGFRQGQMDRRYGRRMGYDNSGMYREGTYGFSRGYGGGMRSRYQRAFQRGFERGYEDGYNSRYRYGYRTNNGLQVVSSILNSIINSSRY